MGGYNAATDTGRVIQEVNLGHGNFDTAAYFNETVYYHAVGDVLKAYTLTNGMLSAVPSAQSTVSYSASGQGATPSISANGTANGIVWDVQFDSSHEVLHAYDATTLAELYNSNQNAARDQLGVGVKFITPTIADGEVFVGASGAVTVYGLLAPPTTAPAAPSNLTAAALNASQIQLTWVNNATNQAGFKIERSTDGVSFTQIAVAAAAALNYIDSNLSASTKYYYQIRATNIIGDSAYAGPVNATTPAVTGAIDVYHFDAGSGATAVDSVGTNNGTLTGTTKPTWVTPGKIGAAALSFSGDGINKQTANESAVTVANDLSPILGGTSSLDVWFKTTQTGSETHYQAPAITGVEQSGAGNDINWGTLNSTGHIGIFVGDGGGVYSTNAVNDGQWHNIAMTRNAITGQVQLFIDGVLNGTATFDTENKTSRFFLIGALSDVANDGVTRTGDNYFNGQLDEVRIYNQVLTAADVQGLAVIPTAPTLNAPIVAPGPIVHLSWTIPSIFTQSIEVDRKTGAAGTYAPIATLAGGVTMFDDVNVTRGTQYFYVVKAIDLAGSSPASNEVNVTPPVPTIVANSAFYNGSSFDGNNGSSNLTDTNAVAPDKQALLPGQTATFQNVTSYSKGINGIIIDVANLDNLPRFEDFTFHVGNDNNPAGWAAAPTPSIINVYPGRGPGGSTQITMIWDDNAVQNEWLQVAVFANAHTGLPADDVFYYGNAIGDTGNSTIDLIVNAADVAGVQANPATSFNPAGNTNVYDFNRDGRVDATDVSIAQAHATTSFNAVNLITVPLTGGGGMLPAAIGSSTPVLSNPAISTPVGATAGSNLTAALAIAPTTLIKATPATVSSASSVSVDAGNKDVSGPPTAASFQRSAIGAFWDSLNDANHATAWWTSGRLQDAGNDLPDPFIASLLEGTSLARAAHQNRVSRA